MSNLELVLVELEAATAALAAVQMENLEGVLGRRSQAMTRLAELTGSGLKLELAEREDALRRLRVAFEAGVVAQQKLTEIKRVVTTEWSRWSQIYRALGASGYREPIRIDCRG